VRTVFRSPPLSRSSTVIGNGSGKGDGRSSAWHAGSTNSLRASGCGIRAGSDRSRVARFQQFRRFDIAETLSQRGGAKEGAACSLSLFVCHEKKRDAAPYRPTAAARPQHARHTAVGLIY